MSDEQEQLFEELSKLSKRYDFYLRKGIDGSLHVTVYKKGTSRQLMGSFDSIDTMLETGLD